MPVGIAKAQDPRTRIAREKYFSVRPKPLERWLWSKNVPASAERVFWLHWQEGQQRGDWCSEIPLRRVANECYLDVSTVTRAYQCLTRLGCLRRTDPGRDPANPFQQATAITEVRIPAELLHTLHQYPNRRQPTEITQTAAEAGRAAETQIRPAPDFRTKPTGPSATTPASDPEANTPITSAISEAAISEAAQSTPPPLPTLNGRDRAKALADITARLSPTERDAYHRALRLHLPTLAFDLNTQVTPENQALLQQTLTTLASDTPSQNSTMTTPPNHTHSPHPSTKPPLRKLSLFHIARLRRDIQSATSSSAAPELLRQVVWSIEAGALRRFTPLHALNIALKKIRAGSWTRPHRMPPNWARSVSTALSATSPPEACSAA